MGEMAAVSTMGDRVAVPAMGDRVAVTTMGDRVAVPPWGICRPPQIHSTQYKTVQKVTCIQTCQCSSVQWQFIQYDHCFTKSPGP